ncbi:MAG: tetratricopeptide repeat protein [Caldimicrobium sp.]
MSKLGKIIRELKTSEEASAKVPDFKKKKEQKKKGIRNFLLLIILIGNIIAGWMLVNIIQKVKFSPSLSKIQSPSAPSTRDLSPKPSPTTQMPPSPAPSPKSEPKAEASKKEPSATSSKALKEKSSRPNHLTTREEKIQEEKRKIEALKREKKISKREIPSEKEEIKPKERVDEKVTLNQGLLLRERELFSNLLLNAEEARRLGHLDDAIYYYETYLKYKKDPNVLNNLGGIYFLKRDYGKAEYYFKLASNMSNEEIYLLNLYLAQLMQGKKEVCKDFLKREFSSFYKEQVERIRNLCK